MRILQSILLATDFLPATEDVTRVAIQLASVFDSHVTLLHVVEPTFIDANDVRHQRDQATTRMHDLVEQLQREKIVVDEVALTVGSPADTIVRKTHEIDADLILIGAGEASRFDRAAGPNAQAILQHAVEPVLVVRPGEPSVHFHQILCPVDHSSASRRGLQNAIRLARAFHGNVVVLSVVPSESWLPLGSVSGTLKTAAEFERHWREEFERFLASTDLNHIAWRKEIRIGVPCEQIAAAARDCWADVIVMGSTGRSGLARMLIGSVTRRVLRHLPCSLLAVKNEDILEELLEGDIRAMQLLLAEGREMFAAGSHAEAAAKFRQVLFHDPFQVTALECLAEAYAKLGRAEDSARYRRRATTLHPQA